MSRMALMALRQVSSTEQPLVCRTLPLRPKEASDVIDSLAPVRYNPQQQVR